MSRKHLPVSLLVCILALVAGCSGGETPSGGSASSRPTVTSAPSAASLTEAPAVTTTRSQQQQPPQIPPVRSVEVTPAPSSLDCHAQHSDGEWGVGPRILGSWPMNPGSGGQVSSAEAGQHACDDWFVVRINAPKSDKIDVAVEYRDEIPRDPADGTVSVVGGAKLHLRIGIHAEEWVMAQTSADGSDFSSFPAPGMFAQWGAIRDVQFINSFEGLTGFAIGVVERNAFTVTKGYWSGLHYIIVKIAH